LKISFINDLDFIVIYHGDISYKEDEVLAFFKLIGKKLKTIYNYVFLGSYQVNIYQKDSFLILNFVNISNRGKIDFDVTLFTNSILLYEFYDFDYVKSEKIFYDGKYYVELDKVIEKFDFLEMGNIIYGSEVEIILRNGRLI